MIRIGLDAGHYVGDSRVPDDFVNQLGTRDEYTLNLRTYNVVAAYLSAAGYDVFDIGRQVSSVTSRAKRAGANGCNAVISLHHNAGGGRGITLFRHTNGVIGAESKRLQESLYNYFKKVNAGNRSNPVTTKELGVINCINTKCPSTLIECAFMDNQADVNLIKSSDYNDRLAKAIIAGLNDYFGIQGSNENKGDEDDMISEVWKNRKVIKTFSPFAVRRVAAVPEGETLAVRIAPDPEAPLLETWPTLSNGNLIDVMVKYDNDWAQILIAGIYTGYVNAAYLSE